MEIDKIEHRPAVEIESMFCARQTCLRIKEYMVKEAMWMKLAHLDHLPKMVNKFEHEKGHELGVKRTMKKKRDPPTNNLSVDEDINL